MILLAMHVQTPSLALFVWEHEVEDRTKEKREGEAAGGSARGTECGVSRDGA